MTKIERADRVVMVPRKAKLEDWTEARAQEWARNEVLFGGPPAKPQDPGTGEVIDWASLKDRAGTQVRIRAQPMGLILTGSDGSRRYVPGDATTGAGGEGFSMGSTVNEMRAGAALESRIREFARAEVERYNKRSTAQVRSREARTASREFWEAGRRIREFIQSTPQASQDRVWFSLEQWGRGLGGYGKAWLEGATYMYDWLPHIESGHPVFLLSETRIMNIIRSTNSSDERARLLSACIDGPFRDLKDEEFKWVTGQSPGTFPLGGDSFARFQTIGLEIRQVGVLASATHDLLNETLHRLRTEVRASRSHKTESPSQALDSETENG